jgi:hypothetical protein
VVSGSNSGGQIFKFEKKIVSCISPSRVHDTLLENMGMASTSSFTALLINALLVSSMKINFMPVGWGKIFWMPTWNEEERTNHGSEHEKTWLLGKMKQETYHMAILADKRPVFQQKVMDGSLLGGIHAEFVGELPASDEATVTLREGLKPLHVANWLK